MRQTEKYQFNLIDPEDHFLPDPLNENMEKVETAISACPHIVAGSYVGTGTYGSNNPCTLTFDFEPKLVMVYSASMGFCGGSYGSKADCSQFIAPRGAASASRVSSGSLYITDYFSWDGNAFSWYSSSNASSPTGALQLNKEGSTYCYLAIG